uniref:Uncharacterized protein n=1 Tax=Mucochytrium quahogii TaxID=96639 RepID=A0A7S2W4Q2_9STRA|mmetsp:Transcript_8721/g.16174  ORF Transcript_8721/g.16174 Transcript_8721/m.16174 type:complete len:1661 (+) Transcript_8721:511-5493(+)
MDEVFGLGSPNSLDVQNISPGEISRARNALGRFTDTDGSSDILEEVEQGRAPTPHSAFEMNTCVEMQAHQDTKVGSVKTLPVGLVRELDSIQTAAKKLLENMDRMESDIHASGQRAAKAATQLGTKRSSSKRNISVSGRRAAKDAIQRRTNRASNKGGHGAKEGANKLTKTASANSEARKRGPRTTGRNNRKPPTTTEVPSSFGRRSTKPISSKKTAQTKPMLRQDQVSIQPPSRSTKVREGDETQTEIISETKESIDNEYLAKELSFLRGELQKLRAVSKVEASLKDAERDTIDLVEGFPTLIKAIDSMEKDTDRAVKDLHGRIEVLVKSYREMNEISARAPLGFLNAMDPHGTISADGAKVKQKPGWIPTIEGFDHEVLHAEADEILATKRKIDHIIENALKYDPSFSYSQEENISAQVNQRIKELDVEIQKYVNLSYEYNLEKENLPENRRRGARKTRKRDELLAPWMNPSTEIKRKSNMPLKAPKIPKFLQQNKQEEQIDKQHSNLKPERVVPTHIEERLLARKLKAQGAEKKSKPKAQASSKGIQAITTVTDDDDNLSVDSFARLVQELDDRRVKQEVFEAAETANDSPREKKPQVKSRDRKIPPPASEQSLALSEEPDSKDTTTTTSDVRLCLPEGSADTLAKEFAYKAVCSILTQSHSVDEHEIMAVAFAAGALIHSIVHDLFARSCLQSVKEVMPPTGAGTRISPLLYLLDARLRASSARLPKTSQTIATVVVAYHKTFGGVMGGEARKALAFEAIKHGQMTSFDVIDAMHGAWQCASSVHSSVLSKVAGIERSKTAVIAATSAFMGLTGKSLDLLGQAAVQAMALVLADGEGVSTLDELGLTNVQSAIVAMETQKGQEVPMAMQNAIRAVIGNVVEASRKMEAKRVHSVAVLEIPTHEKEFTSVLGSPLEDLKLEERDELLGLVHDPTTLEGKTYSCFSKMFPTQGSLNGADFTRIESPVQSRTAVDAAVTKAASILARSPNRAIPAVIDSCVEKADLEVVMLPKKMIPSKDYDATRYGNSALLGTAPPTSMLYGEPKTPSMIDPQPKSKSVDITMPVPASTTNETVLDYVTSNVLAEMIVANEKLPPGSTSHKEPDDAKEEIPLWSGAGVVQWFADKGEAVDKDLVMKTARGLIEDNWSQDDDGPTPIHKVSGGVWSDENILNLVTQMYLSHQTMSNEIEPRSASTQTADTSDKLADTAQDIAASSVTIEDSQLPPPSAPIVDQNTIRAEQAMAAALSSRLAAEAAENSVKMREETIRNEQEDLTRKQQTLSDLQRQAEKAIAEANLQARETQLNRLENEIRRREEYQAELERLRIQQIDATIDRVSEVQVSTFKSAVEQVKTLFDAMHSEAKVKEIVKVKTNETCTQSTQIDEGEISVVQEDNATTEVVRPLTPSNECANAASENNLASPKQEVDPTCAIPTPDTDIKADTEVEQTGTEVEDTIPSDDIPESEEVLESEEVKPPENPLGATGEQQEEKVLYSRNAFVNPSALHAPPFNLGENVHATQAFTSTILNWSDSDDGGSYSGSSHESLSEGELDVPAGDLSDGEDVPLTVAFRSVLKPRVGTEKLATSPPWEFQEGPNADLLKQTLYKSDEAAFLSQNHQGEEEDAPYADLRKIMLQPDELARLHEKMQNEASSSSESEGSVTN